MESTASFCTAPVFATLREEGPVRFNLFRRASQMSEEGARKTLALLKEFRTLSRTKARLLGVNISSNLARLRDSRYVIDAVRDKKYENRKATLTALMEDYCLPMEAATLVLSTPAGLVRDQFEAHHRDKPLQLRDLLWRAYEKLHAAA